MSVSTGHDPPPPQEDRDSLRLFVAIELPPSWKDALRREGHALDQAAPGFGRWVDPDLLHLTVVFLGNQPAGRVDAITATLDQAAGRIPSFTIRPGAPGSFGGRGAVRVVWMGVEDQPRGSLTRLFDSVTAELRAAEVPFDMKPFAPHVTIARARRDAGPAESSAIRQALTGRGSWGRHVSSQDQPATCHEIALIRSDLRPTGPIYTPLHHAVLG